ncbi:MAG: hypothetical protein ABJF23_06100 [Bryobacteraceae bacterium]
MWFIPPNPEDPHVQAAMERAVARLTPDEKKLVSEAFQIYGEFVANPNISAERCELALNASISDEHRAAMDRNEAFLLEEMWKLDPRQGS